MDNFDNFKAFCGWAFWIVLAILFINAVYQIGCAMAASYIDRKK